MKVKNSPANTSTTVKELRLVYVPECVCPLLIQSTWVHKLEDGTVAVFSRNSEDMSKKYPDLVEQLPRCVKESAKSFVLDAEAVAFDVKEDKLMPFQELSKRKRKDVKVEDIQVRVHLFAFDLLYLNGEVGF